jgi:N-acetyl-anhydromuramyl-L-alanine amidase AmpD
MAQPEEVDRWNEARGFECVVRAEDYAPDTVPLWLHLRPGQAFRLHLGYHVYITADGAVWRARPESKAGAHCKVAGRNISHLGVCLAGKLEEQTPSGAQMEALRDVCSRWCVRYGLDPQTAIEGHRDAPGADTDCPGRYLWELLPRLRADVAEMLPSTSAV